MAREYTRDASEYGQQLIADAIEKIAVSVATDDTLTEEGTSADAKAVGDAIGKVSADGNYIKKSATKNVCENIGILDTRAKTNADAISSLGNLISDDGTTMMLFGKVVTIDAETGVVSLSDPEEDNTEEVSGT